MTRSIFSVLSLLAFLTMASAAAGPGAGALQAQARWIPLGPEGGPVRAVAAASNGRTLYAGTPGGLVFKSINRGRTWSPSSEGLRGAVLELQTPEAAPGTVYAVTTAGLFTTFDAARTWTARARGLPRGPFDDPLLSLEIAPSNPAALYVIVRSRAGQDFAVVERVYRSLDAGATWSRADRGLPAGVNDLILDLAVDPARPAVAYAATSAGVFKTTDQGNRWNRTGLTEVAFLVATDRVRPDLVYAVTADFSGGAPQRLQVSTDGGRTWTVRAESDAIRLEPHPDREGTVYAVSLETGGVLETTDAGQTWNPLPGDLPFSFLSRVNDIAVDPKRPDVLYAASQAGGTDPGLFRNDGGDSFLPFAAGIVATAVTSLAFPPDRPEAVFAGLAQDGVHRLDGAPGSVNTWTQLGLDRQPARSLVVDPQAPDTFYALSDNENRVYRSTDGAVTWQLLSTDDLDTRHRSTLAVVDGAVWAGTGGGGFAAVFWDPATGVWARGFGGEGREIASAGSGPATRVWVNNTSSLDAGGGSSSIHFSTDAGATFTTAPIRPLGEVVDFALLDDDPDRVAFGFGAPGLDRYETGGLYVSDDGGATWRQTVFPGAPPVYSIVFDPRDPQRLLAGSVGTIHESLDGGATWSPLSRGLARGAIVSELAFDELGNLYAATLGGGVFRLQDRRP